MASAVRGGPAHQGGRKKLHSRHVRNCRPPPRLPQTPERPPSWPLALFLLHSCQRLVAAIPCQSSTNPAAMRRVAPERVPV